MASLRPISICSRCMRALKARQPAGVSRSYATAADTGLEAPQDELQQPRWRSTPTSMRMPLRVRPQPKQAAWKVNDQQEPLDQMYDQFFGKRGRGRDMLPMEIKWLAVTHKSFDHARQGFNDRLAFLGKRIVDLQTSMALLNAPPPVDLDSSDDIYRHSALEGVESISTFAKETILDRERLASLATSYGINKVVRWKPRQTDKLRSSGEATVLAHTVYSIIGGLALQKGGEVAAQVTRERILRPLGLR